MISSFLLALREGVEAALIIGIVLGALRKLNRSDLNPAVAWGSGVALLFSLLIAAGLRIAGTSLKEPAEQIFEGTSMILAAGILTWMIFWMQRQSRHLKTDLENQLKGSLTAGSRPIFWIAFLAVFREGIELALFLLAASLSTTAENSLIGAMAGLAAAAIIGYLLFTSTRRLPLSKFFQVTNVLLLLFAAGMLASGVHEFNEIGWIPAIVAQIYDINRVLPESSTAGSLLKALFGYNGNPSLTEVIAYVGFIVALVLGLQLRQRSLKTPAPVQVTERS